MSRTTPALAITLFLCLPITLRSDEWGQWLGPKRDGIWRETGLFDAIPADGLKVRWRAPVSLGYGGPAVKDGKVFVMDRVLKEGAKNPANPFDRDKGIPGTERVLCFDAKTGKQLWAFEYDCPYTVSYAGGPRCTPAVDGDRDYDADRVYAHGTEGHLHCLDAQTGKKIWGRKMTENETPVWGYAAHPLVLWNMVIVATNDPKGILVAMDKMTGKVIWQAIPAKECGYSPPVMFDVAGKRQLIQWYPAGVTSLDPETGKVYWTIPQEPMKYGVTIVTPQLLRDSKLGDLLFVSSQYGGALMLKLDKSGNGDPTASVLWKRVGKSDRTSDAIQTLMATPVLRDGHVYGIDAKGQLRGLTAATGDRLWETFETTTYDAGMQSWATAFMTPLGETGPRTLFATEHGDLIVGDLTPAGFKLISKSHLLDPTNTDARRPVLWSQPAYANRSIYWRNDKELVSWSFAKE
ncbi:PQQ-binding-like beta-propeller repeat protein [Humisphaera borealis]|uniref:PQQ-like beta-propeller repeat protein n=1 Tax=Humisphaera borealis TaxID=2807512 RepID=A0A7M2WV15_9BACT|nr:PQQ-binding-like beta-propeller repeat protein [Humisphaera borealis]QOV89325.1 PQQ-like beta-propeller repeat protein [Humisphaera borealis]